MGFEQHRYQINTATASSTTPITSLIMSPLCEYGEHGRHAHQNSYGHCGKHRKCPHGLENMALMISAMESPANVRIRMNSTATEATAPVPFPISFSAYDCQRLPFVPDRGEQHDHIVDRSGEHTSDLSSTEHRADSRTEPGPTPVPGEGLPRQLLQSGVRIEHICWSLHNRGRQPLHGWCKSFRLRFQHLASYEQAVKPVCDGKNAQRNENQG